MKRTYIKPESTTIDCTLSTGFLVGSAEETAIFNGNAGGADGLGGYDPASSLSRDNNTFGDTW